MPAAKTISEFEKKSGWKSVQFFPCEPGWNGSERLVQTSTNTFIIAPSGKSSKGIHEYNTETNEWHIILDYKYAPNRDLGKKGSHTYAFNKTTKQLYIYDYGVSLTKANLKEKKWISEQRIYHNNIDEMGEAIVINNKFNFIGKTHLILNEKNKDKPTFKSVARLNDNFFDIEYNNKYKPHELICIESKGLLLTFGGFVYNDLDATKKRDRNWKRSVFAMSRIINGTN